MKLRNKKTGEVFDLDKMPKWLKESIQLTAIFYSKECEVYEPAEPLIKDEKIRKAVRAWAEANDFIDEIKVEGLNAGTRFSEGHWSIEFIGYFIYDLKIGSIYTIAELCGEEIE